MQTSKIWIVFLAFLVLLVVFFTWLAKDADKHDLTVAGEQEVPVSKNFRNRILREVVNITPNRNTETPKALELPPRSITNEAIQEDRKVRAARMVADDDSILALGGVLEAPVQLDKALAGNRVARLKSILAKDWEGKGNLLVNELRAGLGFEVKFEDVEAFLRGKDLYGWPEGVRNWIGDEMMTMLRQEMPIKAYQLFADIQRDETAPAAMRDYSIQHISHLISDGHVGGEGVNLIRAALESENPVVASTALISLHNLSQQSAGHIAPADVSNLAEQYQDSTDQRLQITAQSIERALSELE